MVADSHYGTSKKSKIIEFRVVINIISGKKLQRGTNGL